MAIDHCTLMLLLTNVQRHIFLAIWKGDAHQMFVGL